MPDTLADLVRKKYPGKYDSLDDDTLEDKISTKYPGKYEHLMPPKRNAPPDALKVDNPDVDAIVADARKSAFSRSVPEEGLDAAGQPKFTIDDMPQAEKPKQYETVGPPLPQAKNEHTPTSEPPSNHSAILDFADSVSRFLNNHPRVQEALTGTSPEFEAMKKNYGITDVKGPGFMRIPGLSEENVNKAAQAVTGESGNVRLGLGALTKALGDMAAVAFDPRATVPERTPSPPHNTFDVPYTVHPDEPPPASGNTFQPTSPVPVRQPPIESRFQPPAAEAAAESRFPSVEQPPTIDAAVSPRTPRSTEIPYRMEPQAPPEEGLPVRQQTQQTVTEAPIQRFMRENPEASMSDIEKFIRSMSATQSAQQGIQPQPQQDLPVRAEDPFTAGATEQRSDIIPQPGGPEFAPTDAIAAPEDQAAQPKADPEENIYTQAINKFNMGKPLPTAPKVQASDLRPDVPYVPVSPFKTVEPQAAVEAPPESAPIAKAESPTATHIGSQPTAEGGAEDLFNIESGPDKGSTVTRAGLEQRGIPVPQIDQSKQGKSGEQLRAEALAAKAKKPSAFAKPEKAPESTGLAPALPDESVMDYHNRTGASIADSEKATGNAPEDYEPSFARQFKPDELYKGSAGKGLEKNKSFEDQWKTAIKEAKTVGLDPSQYDNLDQLQWDITRKAYHITKETGKNPLAEIPENLVSHARTESGGTRMDIGDRKAMIDIFKNTYSGSVPHVAAKELIQNAIDASAEQGTPVEVKSSEKSHTIEVTDHGKGLTRDEIDTVFTNLSSSGKRGGSTKTIGELGVGKTTYLVAGKHVAVDTVARNPESGKLIRVTFNGTPHDIIEGFHPTEEEVPEGTPTGTTVKLQTESTDDYQSMLRYFHNLKDYSATPVPISINHEGHSSYNSEKYEIPAKTQTKGKKVASGIATIKGVNSTKYTVTIPDDATWGENDRIHLILNNRGMFQGVDGWYTGKAEIPDRVIVDLDPLVSGDDISYPLTAPTRERLKEQVRSSIGNMIDKELVNAQKEKREKEIQRIFDKIKTSKGIAVYNGGERYTSEELKEIQSSKPMKELNNIIADMINELHTKYPTANKSSYEPEGKSIVRVGFIFDDLRGVNLQNPGIRNEIIVMSNPFNEMQHFFNDPVSAAQGIVHIGIHEFTHVHVRSEGADFTSQLATIYSSFDLEKQIEYRNRILKAITEGSSVRGPVYSPEIEKLLYKYNESRGRDKTGSDILLREAGSYVLRSEKPKGSSGDGGDAGERTTPGAISRAVANLMEALESVRDTIGEQQEINRSERASRFKNFERTKGSGIDWASKAFSKMKGEHEKADYFSEKQLSKKDVNTLFSAIKNAKVPTDDKVKAVSGMFKILNGDVPVQSEVNVLDDIFGGGFRDKIVQMHGGIGGFGPVRVKLAETANTMKAMKSMLDVSAALRQGAGLALSPGFSKNGIQFINPAYRDAFQMMFKFFYDKKAYNAAMQAIIDDPDYIGARRAGLFLAKPGNLIKAEEAFGKNLIGYLPRWSGVPIAEEASERAYTGFLNILRFQTYKNLIKNAKDAGHVMEKTKQLRDKKGDFKLDEDGNVKTTSEPTKIAKDIAYYINVTTGRGSLGKLEKIVPELNVVLWSPRNVSSRLTMLNPMYYKGLSNFARFEAMKSLFSIAAIATTLLALAKLRGAKISGNILSADFGKARMPPSDRRDAAQIVVDPYTGLQQVVVAAARLTAESHRMVTGGKRAYNQENLLGIAGNFLANKESPIASFAHDLATAQSINFNKREYVNKYGQKKNINPEIANTIMPMIIQDATDVFKSDAKFADQVGLDAVSLLGVGVQNYPETKPQTSKFRKMSIPNR